MKIIWSTLAIDKTSEIAEYIAKDKPTVALDWVDKIFQKVYTEIFSRTWQGCTGNQKKRCQRTYIWQLSHHLPWRKNKYFHSYR